MSRKIDQRVTALEGEVERLKTMLSGEHAGSPWWEQISGVFANDPAFEKAMKLGRQFRQSQRPTPAKPRTRRDGHSRH
jgi:hypothetical protein